LQMPRIQAGFFSLHCTALHRIALPVVSECVKTTLVPT
jgi:hypothetical protein